jgi:hypothetical protein
MVRRDHRIVAAFAKKAHAEEWAQMRSFNDESRFTVHTASEVCVSRWGAGRVSRNRRLVPIPTRENCRSDARAPPAAKPAAAPPAAPIVPNFRNSWPYFAFLIVTAIVMYLAKRPILLIAALVGFVRGLFWLCERYARTMFVVRRSFAG